MRNEVTRRASFWTVAFGLVALLGSYACAGSPTAPSASDELSRGSAPARTAVDEVREFDNPIDEDSLVREVSLNDGITDGQSLDNKDKNKKKGDDDDKDKNKDKDGDKNKDREKNRDDDDDDDDDKNRKKDGEKNKDRDKNKDGNQNEGQNNGRNEGQNQGQNEGQNSNNASGPQPPSLVTSASTVEPGGAVTVTLMNGSPGANQWIALAATGAADTSYLRSIRVGPAVTTRSWTVTMPMTPGTYEFRLFLNSNRGDSLRPGLRADDGDFPSERPARNTRAATSAPVTVMPAPAPPPTVIPAPEPEPPAGPTLSVSPQNVSAGASVTVTLTNGFGGTYDWVTLAAAGAPDTSYMQWTYVGAGVTTFTWTVTMPTTPGTYEFRLFLNGVYTRAATSPEVTVN